ncbi:hypothetical protein, partial [Actinoplanes sp. NPDC020271]|uniref:hypothetical protein n=1 Tax=Actinoplanes sp. NPDC020271 TaxID=3363896 RepID=UPI0037A3C6CF
ISSAVFGSTEADHDANPQFRALPSDNAMALGIVLTYKFDNSKKNEFDQTALVAEVATAL